MNMILTVQENTPGNELEGEDVENWADLRDEWFDLRPLSGREYQQAQQIQSNVTHNATSIYFSGANSRLRLIRREIVESEDPEVETQPQIVRTFNVESVVNVDERNRELLWRLEEAV